MPTLAIELLFTLALFSLIVAPVLGVVAAVLVSLTRQLRGAPASAPSGAEVGPPVARPAP